MCKGAWNFAGRVRRLEDIICIIIKVVVKNPIECLHLYTSWYEAVPDTTHQQGMGAARYQ